MSTDAITVMQLLINLQETLFETIQFWFLETAKNNTKEVQKWKSNRKQKKKAQIIPRK